VTPLGQRPRLQLARRRWYSEDFPVLCDFKGLRGGKFSFSRGGARGICATISRGGLSRTAFSVMAGHSPSKDGRSSNALCPAIYVVQLSANPKASRRLPTWMTGTSPVLTALRPLSPKSRTPDPSP